MEYCDGILCATHAELTDGIMTADTLMYYCKRTKVFGYVVVATVSPHSMM